MSKTYFHQVHFIILASMLFGFISCSKSISDKSKAKKEIVTLAIDSIPFFIDLSYQTELENCLVTDENIKRILLNFNNHNQDFEDECNRKRRKITHRGDLSKIFFSSRDFYYEAFICVDRSGYVRAAKLVKSIPELKGKALKKFFEVVFNYEVEENLSACCVECSKLYFKLGQIEDFEPKDNCDFPNVSKQYKN